MMAAGVARGQEKPAAAGTAAAAKPAPKRQLQAVRISTPIKLDGELDEAVWQTAPIASKFFELEPTPGREEKHPTEVRVLYDDAAIYVGAIMHDVAPDSILRELSARDNIGNSDWFGVFFDTYNDHLNGYEFIVTSGGVQVDLRNSPATGGGENWNAVWDSRTVLRGNDWVAEMRIPYSAIRFSKAVDQVWGLNFGRQRRVTRQKFFWNEVKPQVDGFVNQWGELTGLKDLKPPLRLSLTPYVSAYVNHYPYNEQGKQNASTSFNGGADVKWGINESFTLDATLVPDFGQVQSDNQVLNLSPFEVQYNENRQFFTEGTELFNKGGLFYSRRVGAQPLGFSEADRQLRVGSQEADGSRRQGEFVVQNPGVTRLLNATKVSGRTSKGLGVGVFNALSNDVYATLQDSTSGARREVLTQPFSNYNIVVLDQSLKNNSYVSLINTNVTRAGQTYDANVTGGLFRFANQKNSYAVNGSVVYSNRRGKAFNSEQEIDDQDGYKYYVNLSKISGNFTWSIDHGVESHTYNPNDLGLLFSNNNLSQSLNANYNIYKPFWKVNKLSTYASVSYSLLQKPLRYQEVGFYAGGNTTFTKNFLTTGINLSANPERRDYFDPRREPLGKYYVRLPANFRVDGFVSSDYRKKFAYDVSYAARFFAADGNRTNRNTLYLSLSPRYRASNHLSFVYEASYEAIRNQVGRGRPRRQISAGCRVEKAIWRRRAAGPPDRQHGEQHGHRHLHLHQSHVVQHPAAALREQRALPRLLAPAPRGRGNAGARLRAQPRQHVQRLQRGRGVFVVVCARLAGEHRVEKRQRHVSGIQRRHAALLRQPEQYPQHAAQQQRVSEGVVLPRLPGPAAPPRAGAGLERFRISA
jgi:hypothetical protein